MSHCFPGVTFLGHHLTVSGPLLSSPIKGGVEGVLCYGHSPVFGLCSWHFDSQHGPRLLDAISLPASSQLLDLSF